MSYPLFKCLIFIMSISAILSIKTGIKAGIDQPTLLQGAIHFVPELLKKLVDVKVPSKKFNIDTSVGILTVDVNTILFTVTEIPTDKLNLLLKSPDMVNIIAKNLKAKSSMSVDLKMGFFEDKLPTNINVTTLNVDTDLELLMERSQKLADRFVPGVDAKRLAIEFDFDFKVDSKIIGKILDIDSVKQDIKKYVQQEAQEAIQNKLKEAIKSTFSQFMNNVPLQPKIFGDIAIDYSIVEKPYIEKELLIVNLRGQILNNEIKDTLTPPFDLVDITTSLTDLEKGVDGLTTNYIINTYLYTAILSDKFKIDLNDKIIPPESPVHLNTNTLDYILPGIKAKYGENKPVTLKLKGITPVKSVDIKDGRISLDEFATCQVVVDGNETPAVIFKLEYAASLTAEIVEIDKKSMLKLYLVDIKLKDLQVVETQLPNINVGFAMIVINVSLKSSIPTINKKLSEPREINIPPFYGINLKDLEMKTKTDFIEFAMNADFDPPKPKSYYSKDGTDNKDNESNRGIKYLK